MGSCSDNPTSFQKLPEASSSKRPPLLLQSQMTPCSELLVKGVGSCPPGPCALAPFYSHASPHLPLVTCHRKPRYPPSTLLAGTSLCARAHSSFQPRVRHLPSLSLQISLTQGLLQKLGFSSFCPLPFLPEGHTQELNLLPCFWSTFEKFQIPFLCLGGLILEM